MREILFRGKRTDNGEWVEGFLVKSRWYLDGREIVGIMPLDLVIFPHTEFSEYYEVIPETVGQYTGLADKNGKKIFEGDILLVGGAFTAVVKYGEFCPKQYAKEKYKKYKIIGFFAQGKENCYVLPTDGTRVEVIGNIHLVEGK
jgi:uncharacterized phage protein (TIGR01671 family)